jgi:2-phospho-L-lactate guanylyltransferase
MDVLVPFAARDPNTRLAAVLDPDERRAFARAMLADVVRAVRAAGHHPELLTTERIDADVIPVDHSPPQTLDDRPLTEAVDAALSARDPGPDAPVGVVMADLALATPAAIRRLTGSEATPGSSASDSIPASSDPADVVIAPGLGGGTNGLVVRHPGFRCDYHGASYLDHLAAARRVGASVREVDSRRLATDVDEPADLAELLVHGDGAAHDWLVDAGFELDAGDGRVSVVREE